MTDPVRDVGPRKGDPVLYHDPISGEACAAWIAKVHSPGHPQSAVNLGYLTEEALWGGAREVPHGPGRMGCWWRHGEAAGGGPDAA